MAGTTDVHIHVHTEGVGECRARQLEEQIMTIAEDLAALTANVNEWREDITAKVAALEAVIAEFGAPDEVREAVAGLAGSVAAGVAETGDADGDGTPAPEVTPEP